MSAETLLDIPNPNLIEGSYVVDKGLAVPHNAREARHILRIALGAAGTAAILAADQRVASGYWGNTPPRVQSIGRVPVQKDDVPNIYIGGFNSSFPIGVARALRPTLDAYGPSAVLHDASGEFSVDDNLRATAEWCHTHGTEKVRLVGQSMGGMTAYEMAARLPDEYGINCDGVILDCSPSSRHDLKGFIKFYVGALTNAGRMHFQGGPIIRAAIETGTRYVGAGLSKDKLLPTIIRSIRHYTPDTASNAQAVTKATYISKFDGAAFAGRLTDIPIGHLSPALSRLDPIINNPQALDGSDGWRSLSPHIIDATSMQTGHANAFERPKAYNAMLQKVIVNMGWEPAK